MLENVPAPVLQTGIAVRGNDHYVSNSIVFSALVGVELTGAANILQVRDLSPGFHSIGLKSLACVGWQGVHTWNCATGNGGC